MVRSGEDLLSLGVEGGESGGTDAMTRRTTGEGRTNGGRRRAAAIGLAVALTLGLSPVRAQEAAPYDDHLMRLAEILGALHHLRPLCGADEAQVWRDQMQALIAAVQPPPEGAKKLTDRFIHAYRGLAETHRACTDTARALIERYTAEGAGLAQEVVTRWGRP